MQQQEVKQLSNSELDALMALAMGWRNPNKLLAIYDEILADEHVDAWIDEEDIFVYRVDDYHPTANTTEGKAHCFDLMVKFQLLVSVEKNYTEVIFDNDSIHGSVTNPDTQRAICEAIALSRR